MFATTDGYVMVAAYFPDQWIKLCTALDAIHLIDDPRYATNADRIQNKEQLSDDLTPIFASRGRDEVAARLAEAGVISAPVLSQMEIVNDPELRSLGRFSSVADAEGKILWLPDLPYVASAWAKRRLGPPPKLGEHTEEVLRDTGFTEEEIQAMDDEGVSERTSSRVGEGRRRGRPQAGCAMVLASASALFAAHNNRLNRQLCK